MNQEVFPRTEMGGRASQLTEEASLFQNEEVALPSCPACSANHDSHREISSHHRTTWAQQTAVGLSHRADKKHPEIKLTRGDPEEMPHPFQLREIHLS